MPWYLLRIESRCRNDKLENLILQILKDRDNPQISCSFWTPCTYLTYANLLLYSLPTFQRYIVISFFSSPQPRKTLLSYVQASDQEKDSPAYKTYLVFATGATSPKKERKFKKPASPSRKSTIVTIEEVPELAKKKKKPTKAERSKGGSSDETGSTPGVPDEPKGKSVDTHKGTGLKPGVPDVSTTDSSESENESWDDSGDEANIQNDDDLEQANDELTKTDNPRTNAKPDDEEQGTKEMIDAGHVDVEHENVNQEGAGNQVKDDAQATQKTKVPIPIPRTSSLLTIPVSVIPEHNVINPSKTITTASATTISSLLSSLFPFLQQLTPILTPTTEATTSTTTVPDSETLFALHQRVTDLEKDVQELRNVDNSTKVISTIKSEVPKAIKEYFRSSLDDALHKVIQRNFTDIVKEQYVPSEIVERLTQQYAP
ncbi:hypothetical protein Tco_0765808 [Tanacetum coccineum]